MDEASAIERARKVLGSPGLTRFVQQAKLVQFRQEYRNLVAWAAAVKQNKTLDQRLIEESLSVETSRLNQLRESGPYWLLRFSSLGTTGFGTEDSSIQVRVYVDSGHVEIEDPARKTCQSPGTATEDFA